MAISISDEELQLKKRARRRLIGAIALVTVVAVFLPMVLDHEPRPVSQDINIQIPSQNAGTFTSKIVPVVLPGGADSKAEPAPAESAAPTKPEPAKTAAQPSAKDHEAAPVKAPVAASKAAAAEAKAKPVARRRRTTPKPRHPSSRRPKRQPSRRPAEATAKPEAKAKSAKADSGAFVVQVAALTDADKAKQMREQIAAEGVKAYIEVVPTTKGNVTRVRAGPFASRAAAEKARDRLKEMGLAGNVVPKIGAMTWIDYAVLAIIGVSILLSIIHGFVRELLSLAGWIVAFLVAQFFAADVAAKLPAAIPHDTLRLLAAFVIVFLAVLLAATLLAIALSGLIKKAGLGAHRPPARRGVRLCPRHHRGHDHRAAGRPDGAADHAGVAPCDDQRAARSAGQDHQGLATI